MKNKNKLLVVILALAVVLSSFAFTTLTTSAADAKVLLDWDFTVENNKVKDNSGNGNDGTIENVTVADGVATFAGKEDEHIRLPANLFDGVSENAVVTIELVMTPTITENFTTFLHFGESNQDFVVLALMGDNNLRYATNAMAKGSGEISVNSDVNAITENQANTVKYVIDKNHTVVYVNDAYKTEMGTGKNYWIGNVDSNAALGGKAFWADPCFTGTVDSLKISVEERTAADPSVKPTLPATEDEVLAYVDFVNAPVNATIGEGVEVKDGVATMEDDEIVFNSDILSKVKDTLTVEMVIKPAANDRNHEVFMSMGDSSEAPYIVMGRFGTSAKVKLNERQSGEILAAGEWFTIKYVITNGMSQIYVNGEEHVAKAAGVDLANVKGAIKFGAYTVEQWKDASFKGEVSEIRISTNDPDKVTQNPENPTPTPDQGTTTPTPTPDQGNTTPDQGSTTVPTLDKTDNKVLFYTDFSDVSKLVVKEVDADRDKVDAANDKVVEPTLDADGNMVMSAKQYIDLGIASLKDQKEVTIEFVIKPSEIVDHAAFAGLGTAEDNGWMVLGMQTESAIKFGMKSNDIEIGGSGSGKSEEGLLAVDTWVKVKYVITESTVTMFVNDKAVKNPDGSAVLSFDLTGQMTLADFANLENANFVFGQQTKWDDAGFSGTISEIRVSAGVVDAPTVPSQTGDVASVAAILVAGVAALGGLKLRKKSK